MKRILVCGVGSVLLGDDAAGPYAARWIAANYEFECAGSGVTVEVEDLGTPGLDLIAYMSGIDVLILIDSVANSLPPGTVTIYDQQGITDHAPAARLDPHAPCITESILVAELSGLGPENVYLIGVTPENLEIGTRLSESVRNSIPLIANKVLECVALHGGSFRRRDDPLDPAIWWEPAEMPRIR